MIDLPPELPPEVEVSSTLIYECAEYAADHYKVSPYVVLAVIDVEGGKQGTVSKNSNGSYDLGVMQINTINLELINNEFPEVNWQVLAYEPCVNIGIGTWLLSKRINEAGELWKGVGNYHSRTPKYHRKYLSRIYGAYDRVISKYLTSTIKKQLGAK